MSIINQSINNQSIKNHVSGSLAGERRNKTTKQVNLSHSHGQLIIVYQTKTETMQVPSNGNNCRMKEWGEIEKEKRKNKDC